jgi:hypothetical protein
MVFKIISKFLSIVQYLNIFLFQYIFLVLNNIFNKLYYQRRYIETRFFIYLNSLIVYMLGNIILNYSVFGGQHYELS